MSHAASARRCGLGEAEIEAIAVPERWTSMFAPAEIAALDLATRLCHDSHALDAELIGRLGRHFDDRQLAELILIAGQANLNNRVGNAAKQLFARG
jgi:alkylhydroperoxidase family enzyme